VAEKLAEYEASFDEFNSILSQLAEVIEIADNDEDKATAQEEHDVLKAAFDEKLNEFEAFLAENGEIIAKIEEARTTSAEPTAENPDGLEPLKLTEEEVAAAVETVEENEAAEREEAAEATQEKKGKKNAKKKK